MTSSLSGFKECLDNTQIHGFISRLPCLESGVGLCDLHGSLPAQDILYILTLFQQKPLCFDGVVMERFQLKLFVLLN